MVECHVLETLLDVNIADLTSHNWLFGGCLHDHGCSVGSVLMGLVLEIFKIFIEKLWTVEVRIGSTHLYRRSHLNSPGGRGQRVERSDWLSERETLGSSQSVASSHLHWLVIGGV